MNGVHTRSPCEKCTLHALHAWLLRDLRNAVAEARLRGMRECDVPTITVDCEGLYTPASLVRHRSA